jgi:hypothetical protein
MKALWAWLCKERELPGPLRYLDVFKLRRFLTLKRVVIFVCVVVGLHTGLNVAAYLALESELARVRAAGIEMDLKKYNEPQAPEEENAAPLYQAAGLLLSRHVGAGDEVLQAIEQSWPAKGSPDAELKAKVQLYLSVPDVALALDIIDRANSLPRCTWKIDYTLGHALEIPHLMTVHSIGRALTVRALLQYLEQDDKGAVDDIKAVTHLAESVEQDRLLASELTQANLSNRCREAVLSMATAAAMSRETAQELMGCFARFYELADITEALRLETAMGYAATQELLENAALAREWRLPSVYLSYPMRPLYRWSQARYLRHQLAAIRLSESPYYEVATQLRELEEQRETRVFRLVGLLGTADFISGAQTQAKTKAQVARLGLATEAFRAQKGTYPDSLSALVPEVLSEVPPDPFSGRPFRYLLTESELVIYSVGKNQRDDGGLKAEWKRGQWINRGTDDIAWRVSR